MSDPAFETRLIECLDALESGQPLDEILARFPQDADRLRPLLRTAAALHDYRTPRHLPHAQSESRRAFLSAAARISPRAHPRSFPLTRAVGWLTVGLALLGLLAALTSSALPGQPLYGARRGIEELRLVLALDERAREDLINQFAQNRIEEVRVLRDSGGQARVEFIGVIQSIRPVQWSISGLVVTIGPATLLPDQPYVGQRVRVQAMVMNGQITALVIAPLQAATPTPSPTPTPAATPTLRPGGEETEDAGDESDDEEEDYGGDVHD